MTSAVSGDPLPVFRIQNPRTQEPKTGEYMTTHTLALTPRKTHAEYMGHERVRYRWACGHEQTVDHALVPPHGEKSPCNHIRARWIAFAWGHLPTMPAHTCPMCSKSRHEAAKKKKSKSAPRRKTDNGRKEKAKTSGRVRAS